MENPWTTDETHYEHMEHPWHTIETLLKHPWNTHKSIWLPLTPFNTLLTSKP